MTQNYDRIFYTGVLFYTDIQVWGYQLGSWCSPFSSCQVPSLAACAQGWLLWGTHDRSAGCRTAWRVCWENCCCLCESEADGTKYCTWLGHRQWKKKCIPRHLFIPRVWRYQISTHQWPILGSPWCLRKTSHLQWYFHLKCSNRYMGESVQKEDRLTVSHQDPKLLHKVHVFSFQQRFYNGRVGFRLWLCSLEIHSMVRRLHLYGNTLYVQKFSAYRRWSGNLLLKGFGGAL